MMTKKVKQFPFLGDVSNFTISQPRRMDMWWETELTQMTSCSVYMSLLPLPGNKDFSTLKA